MIEAPLWGGRRVPFTLLAGYLGAGKTTIVNHILRHAADRRLVVVVNDVAAVNVDAALIADHDGETLTLTNGCVCCGIADDVAQTMELVRAVPEPPDHVLMELSGVGEPARVAPWANTTGFRLDGIVVAADADQVVGLAERRFVGDTVRAQLGAADLVMLTKTDLAADRGAAARELVGRSTDAPIVEVIDGAIDVDVVLGVARTGELPGVAPGPAPDGRRDAAASVIDVGTVTHAQLDALVAALDPMVLRAKGLVRCADRDHPVEVHVVGRRRSLTERRDLPLGRAGTTIAVVTPPGDHLRPAGQVGRVRPSR